MFLTPTGPSDPASAPNHSRISWGCAGRTSVAPKADDYDRIKGVWIATAGEEDGKAINKEKLDQWRFVFDGHISGG